MYYYCCSPRFGYKEIYKLSGSRETTKQKFLLVPEVLISGAAMFTCTTQFGARGSTKSMYS